MQRSQKREIVMVDKKLASRPNKVRDQNREDEKAKKTTYNVYADAHIRGCQNRDKRKELYRELNKEEEKERQLKIAQTDQFVPEEGVLLILSFYFLL
jgi:hypothetical protein